MKGKGNLSFCSAKKPERANRFILWLWKSQENILVLWFTTVHLQQLKRMKSSKLDMWKGCHLSKEGIQKGYLFCNKWSITGLGVGPWSGASLSKTLLSTPPFGMTGQDSAQAKGMWYKLIILVSLQEGGSGLLPFVRGEICSASFCGVNWRFWYPLGGLASLLEATL